MERRSVLLDPTCGLLRIQVALGEHAERGALSVPRRRGLPVHGRAFPHDGSQRAVPHAEFTSSRAVAADVLTLDGLCERERIDRVDFVKADVEGAELSVLRGGEAALAAHHPTLLLEIEERHVRKYDVDATAVVDWLTRDPPVEFCLPLPLVSFPLLGSLDRQLLGDRRSIG